MNVDPGLPPGRGELTAISVTASIRIGLDLTNGEAHSWTVISHGQYINY